LDDFVGPAEAPRLPIHDQNAAVFEQPGDRGGVAEEQRVLQ
jgi:hypothetical protein